MNYASQINKIHSLIDHLKDQENGYMDLLNSFSKFQELTTSLYSSDANKAKSDNKPPKDILDLSELNESLGLQQQEQLIQQEKLKNEKPVNRTEVTDSLSLRSSNSKRKVKMINLQRALLQVVL